MCSSNEYIPPARRPPSGSSTISGAPVDTAILSSQLARPDKPAERAKPLQSKTSKPEVSKPPMTTKSSFAATPAPADLVTIIAKDPAKQKEIQEKAKRSAEEAKTSSAEAVKSINPASELRLAQRPAPSIHGVSTEHLQAPGRSISPGSPQQPIPLVGSSYKGAPPVESPGGSPVAAAGFSIPV